MARELLALLVVLAGIAVAQESLPLARQVSVTEAAQRSGADFRPALLGELVQLEGIALRPPIEAQDGVLLALAGKEGQGALLLVFAGDNRSQAPSTAQVQAGSVVEATGMISLHAGQAVLKPQEWKVLRREQPVSATAIQVSEAASVESVGRYVELIGRVEELKDTSAGISFLLHSDDASIRVQFLRPARPAFPLEAGESVKVRGIVTQAALSPPYNRNFQLVASAASDLDVLPSECEEDLRLLPAVVMLVGIGIIGAWYAQQKAARQQQAMQYLLEASEALSGVASLRDVAEILAQRLTKFFPAARIYTYRFDEERKLCERIPEGGNPEAHTFRLDQSRNAEEKILVAAIQNQDLAIATDAEKQLNLLACPLSTRERTLGAILIASPAGKKLLNPAWQSPFRHLAFDAAMQLDRLEQNSLREQVHRSEKLAVAGQLIHGVLTELHGPLESIRKLSQALECAEAQAIGEEVERASSTVNRIVSVARAEQVDSRPVALRPLLEKLAANVPVPLQLHLPPENLEVLGSQAQLQKVFENLLAHAAAAAAQNPESQISLTASRIGRSAMVEIEFSGPLDEAEGPDFSRTALGLAIARGLLQSHGGDVRFAPLLRGRYRYETELPCLGTASGDPTASDSPAASEGELTVLLVEPDAASQRRVLAMFGELPHRLVPVSGMEEAIEFSEKIRFDLILCSSRPEGGNWTELFHRVHHRTPHFTVMSEGMGLTDAANSGASAEQSLLDGRSASMISKPVEREELLRLLSGLEAKSA
jgi:signal transduction histidine kinase